MFMRESPDTNETALLMQFSRFWCWFTNSEDINDYVSRLFRALHNRFFQPPPFFFCNITFFCIMNSFMRQHVCAYCCFSSAHSSLLYADDNDDGLFIELYCVALVFGNALVQRLCSKNQIFFIDICARYKNGLAFKKRKIIWQGI